MSATAEYKSYTTVQNTTAAEDPCEQRKMCCNEGAGMQTKVVTCSASVSCRTCPGAHRPVSQATDRQDSLGRLESCARGHGLRVKIPSAIDSCCSCRHIYESWDSISTEGSAAGLRRNTQAQWSVQCSQASSKSKHPAIPSHHQHYKSTLPKEIASTVGCIHVQTSQSICETNTVLTLLIAREV